MEEPSIFLKLSGRRVYIKEKNEYTFFSNNSDDPYLTSSLIKLVDPSIDSTFKYLFNNPNTEKLENMLNSILFPDFPKLSNIEIINTEIEKPGHKHNKGTIRADLACSAFLENDSVIILGIEIQIGIYGDFSKRLLNYNKGLSFKNDYKKTWTIGLFINMTKKPINSRSIKLVETQNGQKTELNDLKIIEIDLSEEIRKINNGEEIFIDGKKLGNYGKEWIKLLGLRTWCSQKLDRYILPNNFLLSTNNLFNEAIDVLSKVPDEIINSSLSLDNDIKNYLYELQKEKEEGIIEGKIETLIKSSFNLFRNKVEDNIIREILDDEKFKQEKVIDFLR